MFKNIDNCFGRKRWLMWFLYNIVVQEGHRISLCTRQREAKGDLALHTYVCLDVSSTQWCQMHKGINSMQRAQNVSFWVIVRELRATSHTSLKALDHGNIGVLVGRKGRDRPSHFTLGGEGLKAQKKIHG